MEQLKILSLIVVLSALPASGRIAGKVSYSSYNYSGEFFLISSYHIAKDIIL
jgi:hypothetical protein